MKKILSLALVLVLSLAALTGLVSCGGGSYKLGLGVFSETSDIASAEGAKNGSATVETTVAAVIVDGDGKIVKCNIDALDATFAFTSGGAAVTPESFKTKKELGDAYGMKAWGGADLEWYEQVAAFESVAVGKTKDTVAELVTNTGKGSEDVIAAGCTIYVNGFVKALERALANVGNVTFGDATLEVGMVTATETKNATAAAAGSFDYELTVAAVAKSSDGTVLAVSEDAVGAEVTFNQAGVTTLTAGEVKTKRALGDEYGMKAWGGAELEWYEQVNALEGVLVGKNKAGIAALVTNGGTGTADVTATGCTIAITDLVGAVVKALG